MFETVMLCASCLSLILLAPLSFILKQMHDNYQSELRDLVYMMVYLFVYNFECVYYYTMEFISKVFESQYDDISKQNNFIFLASATFPIQQFTWLQAHWLFALLYLKLTKSLQN